MKRFAHIIGTLYLCAVMILLPVSAALAEGEEYGADAGSELTAGIQEEGQDVVTEDATEGEPAAEGADQTETAEPEQGAAEETAGEDPEEPAAEEPVAENPEEPAAEEPAEEDAEQPAEEDTPETEQFTYTEPENGIPLVIIYVDENAEDIEAAHRDDPAHTYGTIDDMNGSDDHSVRSIGSVEILVPDEYKGEYGSTSVPSGKAELEYIRGRGNSTWGAGKKPYKFKYKKKQNLFGMGANKEWALLANRMDASYLRNRFTFWLGQQIGMEFTPQSIPVDVVMVGYDGEVINSDKYIGSYCLTELVEVKKDRLDIDELEDEWTESGEPNETGGFLLSYWSEGQNSDEPESNVFRTAHGIELINDTPAYDDTGGPLTAWQETTRKYIRDYVQEVEDLIMSDDVISPEQHDKIASMLDLQSAADYWLLQEFSANGDGFVTSSTYLYKPRDGKLCFGPLWDFDIAYGEAEEGEDDYQAISGFDKTIMPWISQLRQADPLFCELLKERWKVLDQSIGELIRDGGQLDKYKSEIARSVAADVRAVEGSSGSDFNSSVENLRRWLGLRRAWITSNIDEKIGKVYATVTFVADGEVLRVDKKVMLGDMIRDYPDPPEKEGHYFVRWVYEVDGQMMNVENMAIREDTTVYAEYLAEGDTVKPSRIFLPVYEAWIYKGQWFTDLMEAKFEPEEPSFRTITWSSDNEEIAYADEDGVVEGREVGDVTVTATAFNGVTATCLIHVYDDEATPPADLESVQFDKESIEMTVGEMTQVGYTLYPAGNPVRHGSFYYESSDAEIVKVEDYNGAVTALRPGKAVITLKMADPEEDRYFTDSYTVTVRESGGSDEGGEGGEGGGDHAASISGATVTGIAAKTYTGKALTQSPVVALNGTKLARGTDYTLSYKNNRNVGTATLTITGKGKYTGALTRTFRIRPKGTSLKKLVRGRKAITVRWKKQTRKMSSSRITGYQIQLATDKKFTKNKRSVSVAGYKKVSKKIKGLKGKKRYYVRIRTYKTIKGVRYYSTWSKAKKVTTRK